MREATREGGTLNDRAIQPAPHKQNESSLSTLSRSQAEHDFREAALILDGPEGFGGALWDAEMQVALGARSEIRDAGENEKSAVFQKCMHKLREAMVAEIERWASRHVELAAAYPRFTNPDPTEWARDRMQKAIDKRLRKPDLDGAVAFAIITMSGGDVTAKHQWIPPKWLCSPRETPFTIRFEHGGVAQRLEYALKKALAHLTIGIAIDRGTSSSRKRPRMRSSLRNAICACWEQNPDLKFNDKGTTAWLKQNNPTVIPPSWDEDSSLPGKTYTKIRNLLK